MTQITIAYQTAEEESAAQLVSPISRFCAMAHLVAHVHGFLRARAYVVRAHACVVRARPRA